ncbi:HBL/NHE enterotoxin family protein [Bacillus sp. TH13]|uniref:HBL/NHE enterotoxin family protein n=1 Tax=Bacillus sp. TH13 TaxID=2796379 RepID=UPI001914B1E5|nr:HBL/NHE enterotoxin family protein [Bacillus sp. TH13]MBK5491806.1 HBL/NHE enterotoxin family protein [Bacillus sp. TH13]
MKKTIIASLLLTSVSMSSLGSVSAYAEGGKSKLMITSSQSITVGNMFNNSIRVLGVQTPLIQTYGLLILKQPDIQLQTNNLTLHQQSVKEKARNWLDEYKPKLIDLNQDMRQFSIIFNNYYTDLYDLAKDMDGNQETKEEVIYGINEVQDQIQTTQNSIEKNRLEINRFNTLLNKDSKNLSEDAKVAYKALEGSEGNILKIKNEVNNIQQAIQTELAKILNRPNEIMKGSINIGKQVATIVDTAGQKKQFNISAIQSINDELINLSDSQVTVASHNIQQKQKELITLVKGLSEAQIQVTEINLIENQVKGFTQQIEKQITALEYVLSDWKMLNDSMVQLKNDINKGMTNGETIQKKLIEVKKTSDEIYKQTDQFKDIITNVQIKSF